MSSDKHFPFDFSFLSPETRADIARRFGEKMAQVVTEAMACALREVAAEAARVGLVPEEAVVGFLHLCRDMHESLRQAGQEGGGRFN